MATISTSIELYDRISAPLMSIISALETTASSMYDVRSAVESNVDTSSLDAVTQAAELAAAAIAAMNQEMSGESATPSFEPQQIPTSSKPVRIPAEFEINDLEVFTGTGIDRFQQEITSTNQMLTALCDRQNELAQKAAGTDFFSDSAVQDINSIGQRIQVIQQRIQQIENNPFNMGTDRANEELEQLRSQLNKTLQAQDDLNQAIQGMDFESANAAYNQLSQTVSNTERYIRDNVDEQGRFNESINDGASAMDGLGNKVLGLVAAYASLQSVQKVMDISDELTQTTARIDMMNDGLQTTPELMNMIYQSAQNARGSFTDMASVVAKFGNNAGDAFGSSEEVVAFANLIQKQMTIAGASTAEASNAMLQLSQALGSGTLRGDELNSIFEQAPNLIQSIADYLDVPIGQIRAMAQEGQLSADIVKNAIFAASDEINAQFEQMPMTWNQVWTTMKNGALMQFQPVLDKINELANNEQFQKFASGAVAALAIVSMHLLDIMELVGMVGSFIGDNWSIIEPIIMGIVTALGLYYGAMLLYNTITGISTAITAAKSFAETVHAASLAMQTGATFSATAAQYGFNAALLACPLTWIILLIIAVIAVIFAVCAAIAKLTGVANTGFGVMTGGINVVIQFFKNLGLSVANIAIGIGNAIAALTSNMMTAFNNAICSIQSWFYGLLSTALGVVESICAALNKLPFVEFDYSGISAKADEYAAKSAEAAGNKQDYKSISDAFSKGFDTFDTFQDGWASDAFSAGAAWGDGVTESISNMFDPSESGNGIDTSNLFSGSGYDGYGGYDASQIPGNIADTAGNTGSMADSMDITSEDLKYLRDIAETEVVNRFTTAEIKVEMTNNNNISSDMDLDGMVDYLANGVNEAMEKAAEGVHA